MDLLKSEIARLVYAYLLEFDELKPEAESFLNKCPDLSELSHHLRRGGRICSLKVNQKNLQEHINEINKPSVTTIEFDEQRLICSVNNSINELLNGKLSQLSQKSDLDKQQKDIETKLELLLEKHCTFDKLNQTINEQFTRMNTLLNDITEQTNKFELGMISFNEQISKLITTNQASLTSLSDTFSARSEQSNQFKCLEGKLKVEIANKSQYVTSFVLNEFTNLKSLLESIVSSNYERIEKSTNQLKDCNQQYRQVQAAMLPLGQETPPSESCRNEPIVNSSMSTPTSSELCSQSPSYSELSLGDLISENSRADLNRQISQAVALAANNQAGKYANLITNALYKSTTSQISGFLFTPSKPIDTNECPLVPQTPSLDGRGGENFCVNLNLSQFIDEILHANSPLKNILGPTCAQLSTKKLFPATPDITLDTHIEFKIPDPVVKNFSEIIKTPKSKDNIVEPEMEMCITEVPVNNDTTILENDPIITNNEPVSQPEQSHQPEMDAAQACQESHDEIVQSAQTEIVSLSPPVFANQHMMATRSSPRRQVTTIERLPPSPVKKADTPLNDVTKARANTPEEPLRKTPTPAVVKSGVNNNRGRAQKFATSQQQIRLSLSQNQATVQDQNQLVFQDTDRTYVYSIDPSQTLYCVNDLQGNTYLQTADGIEPVYFQQDASIIQGVISQPTPVEPSQTAAPGYAMPSISVSTFTGSPVPGFNPSATSSSVENKEPEKSKKVVEKDDKAEEHGTGRNRKKRKATEESTKEDKTKNKQLRSSKNLIICQDFDQFLRSQH